MSHVSRHFQAGRRECMTRQFAFDLQQCWICTPARPDHDDDDVLAKRERRRESEGGEEKIRLVSRYCQPWNLWGFVSTTNLELADFCGSLFSPIFFSYLPSFFFSASFFLEKRRYAGTIDHLMLGWLASAPVRTDFTSTIADRHCNVSVCPRVRSPPPLPPPPARGPGDATLLVHGPLLD